MLDRDRLERALRDTAPELASAVRTYVGEADFFHPLLSERLAGRGPLTVAEVGAGIGLLAMRFAADGHHVIAFEPQSAGYDRNHEMRQLVQECWSGPPPEVTWHDSVFDPTVLDPARPIDAALSVNVLEHVERPAALVQQVVAALGPGGTYRVVCPNYAVPYEPHFNMPTLWSKPLTARVFARRIDDADKFDPRGLWDELSWPTQRGLAAELAARGIDVTFDRRAMRAYLDRILDDPGFTERKGRALAGGIRVAGSALRAVVDRVPLALVPVIDATATSRTAAGAG